MTYQLTDELDWIRHIPSGTDIPKGHRLWDAYEAWLSEGNTPIPRQSMQFDYVVTKAIDGIQAWLDSTAAQNGYDGAVSCASYATSSVARWRQDAAALMAWRDAVWQEAHAWRASLGGQLPSPIPTIENIIATLPPARDYGWVVHQEGASSETGEQS